jgi:hypothetical protein
VLWIDGTWTVANGRPVRLHRSDDLECLLESAVDLIDLDLLDPHDALTAIHHLVTNDRIDLDTPVDGTGAELDPDPTPNVQATTELETSSSPTRQVLHRLAPVCEPAPDAVAERGAERC